MRQLNDFLDNHNGEIALNEALQINEVNFRGKFTYEDLVGLWSEIEFYDALEGSELPMEKDDTVDLDAAEANDSDDFFELHKMETISNNRNRLLANKYSQKLYFACDRNANKAAKMVDWLMSAMAGSQIAGYKNGLKVIYNYWDKLIYTNKVEKFLGCGVEGFAVDAGDKIIKVFYGPLKSYVKQFYDLCETGKYKCLPRIFRRSGKTIVMEKLSVTTDPKTCDPEVRALAQLALQNIPTDNEKVNATWKEFTKAMSSIGREAKHCDGNIWNIGKRKNGDLVIFDP